MKIIKLGLIVSAMVIAGLSQSAIGQNLDEGLVAYYPFNGNADDETGNGNNGVVNRAKLAKDRFGNNNSAYSFDGNSSISLSKSLNKYSPTNNQGISISFWSKKTSTGFVISQYKNFSAGASNYFIKVTDKGALQLVGNGTGVIIDDSSGRQLKEWNHWVFQLYPGEAKSNVFLNGKLTITGDATLNDKTSGTQIFIGRLSNSTDMFRGTLDDFRIYNRKLSDSEINKLFKIESKEPSNPVTGEPIGEPIGKPMHGSKSSYQIIAGSFTWNEAKKDAENRGGHLATITSDEENTVVTKLVGGGSYYIGASDATNEGEWQWVTGEPWVYTFWLPNEPNNIGNEDYLAATENGWNDVKAIYKTGYIIEFPNENDDLDLTKKYDIIIGRFTWTQAKLDAKLRGGHLATITSEIEQHKISQLIVNYNGKFWLGGEGVGDKRWSWVTGESWSFQNWDKGEPFGDQRKVDDNFFPQSNYITISGGENDETYLVNYFGRDFTRHSNFGFWGTSIDGAEYSYILEKIENKKYLKGLVAYYPFGGSNSMTVKESDVNDYSGNGFHGKVKYGSSGSLLKHRDRYGFRRSAIEFNGIDQFIDLSDNDFGISGAHPRSIFGWIKTAKKTNTLVSMGTPSDSQAFTLGNINGNGSLGVMAYNNDFYPAKGADYTNNKWHHIGVTYDKNGILKTYINGKLDNSTKKILNTKGNNNYIGVNNHSFTKYTKGIIDDIRIYNRSLDEDEVMELYNNESFASLVPVLKIKKDYASNFDQYKIQWEADYPRNKFFIVLSHDLNEWKILGDRDNNPDLKTGYQFHSYFLRPKKSLEQLYFKLLMYE